MNALFAVGRQERTIHVAKDGQHWNSDMDARRYNARLAMKKVLLGSKGQRRYDVTPIHNLTGYAPLRDVIALRDMVKAHVELVKPRFVAIPDPVGWVKEDGGRVRHPIRLAWGSTSDDRLDASVSTLLQLFAWMASGTIPMNIGDEPAVDAVVRSLALPTTKLTTEGVYAICGVHHLLGRPADAKRDLSGYAFGRRFKVYLDDRNARGNPKPGLEERLLQALDAAVIELETPVPQA